MKRINEILKSLNFPKFYSKTRDGGFIFNPSEKYTDVDLITLLNNFPFTEDTIHEDDVQFIIQYLQYLNCIDKKVIDSYILKLIDNTSLVDTKTKVEDILSNFTKRCRKILNKIDLEDNYCDCKKHKSKSQEKLLEPVIEMMETLAGAMLKTIEKKEDEKLLKIRKRKIKHNFFNSKNFRIFVLLKR
jgi:hydroxymethylpyrimidine pyrophosphatase-like HAD family hydrolase